MTRQQVVGLSEGLSFSLITELRTFLNGEKNPVTVELKGDLNDIHHYVLD